MNEQNDERKVYFSGLISAYSVVPIIAKMSARQPNPNTKSNQLARSLDACMEEEQERGGWMQDDVQTTRKSSNDMDPHAGIDRTSVVTISCRFWKNVIVRSTRNALRVARVR